jgi:hypothetical protein
MEKFLVVGKQYVRYIIKNIVDCTQRLLLQKLQGAHRVRSVFNETVFSKQVIKLKKNFN